MDGKRNKNLRQQSLYTEAIDQERGDSVDDKADEGEHSKCRHLSLTGHRIQLIQLRG